jgi:hypothetical protein
MNFKTIATASVALLMLSGASFAQTASGTNGQNGSGPNITFQSDNEKMMYEQNMNSMSGFFTDDTMATLKPEAEVKAQFEAMGADDKAGMKTACQKAMEDRGSYGTVTTSLCQQVMAM